MFATSEANNARLATLRRAQALSGPDQVRLVATAFFAFMLLQLVRISFIDPEMASASNAFNMSMDVVSYIALIIMLWRPRLGVGIALIPLAASLVWGPTSMDVWLILVVTFAAIVFFRKMNAMLTVGTLALFIVARLMLHPAPDDQHLQLLTLAIPFALGAVAGVVARRYKMRRDDAVKTARLLRKQTSRMRDQERWLLTHELHDAITHQLSNASLQIMGHADSEDPAVLRTVLSRVEQSTRSALTELRLLVRMVEDEQRFAGDGVKSLTQRLSPTMAAEQASVALTQAGFEPDIRVPAEADQLEMTVQRTLTRVIDEATSNIIQHAEPGSRCVFVAVLNNTQVSLTISSELPAQDTHKTEDRLGWGLRTLAERVDLTGGTISAGPVKDQWVLTTTLPHE